MNNINFFYILLGLFILILLCKNNIENYNNLIDSKYEFSMINSIQNLKDGYHENICKDDPEWTNNGKYCRDYSIIGQDCSDIGDNGTSALNSCLVSCNNCPSSIKIKKKEQSKLDEINEIKEIDELILDYDYTNIFDTLQDIEFKLKNLIYLSEGQILPQSPEDTTPGQ